MSLSCVLMGILFLCRYFLVMPRADEYLEFSDTFVTFCDMHSSHSQKNIVINRIPEYPTFNISNGFLGMAIGEWFLINNMVRNIITKHAWPWLFLSIAHHHIPRNRIINSVMFKFTHFVYTSFYLWKVHCVRNICWHTHHYALHRRRAQRQYTLHSTCRSSNIECNNFRQSIPRCHFIMDY